VLTDELASSRVEFAVQPIGGVRRSRKPRAAHAHAVECEMHTRVPYRPDDVVLEAVERNRPTAYDELPKIKEPDPAEPVKPLGHPGVDHAIHCKRVVGVYVIGQ